ncbi:hypothetical protein [Sunxiuqinia rutila]|uniref:hypothetical protein n=1 Tax=Sunxiuqinia rutila TaxID=1397841 RepID=UPI003D36F6B8
MPEYEIAHEFMGWRYVQDTSTNLKAGLQVIPPYERPRPKALYKFYSLSDYNLDALQNGYLYAAHPWELNDKFDCFDGLIDLDTVEDRFVRYYYQIYHEEIESEEHYNWFKANFRKFFPISLYSGFGIVSLTENIANPIMWAHYASSNHGFALKLKLKHLHDKLLGPFPINYQEEWEPLSLKAPAITFLYLTNIKSKNWEKEEEWRLVGLGKDMSTPGHMEDEEFKNNRKFPYPKEAIEEVLLGNMFTDKMRKHYDEKLGTVVLALTPNVAYVEQKAQVLEFIAKNGLQASYTYPDVQNRNFALSQIRIRLEQVDKYTFLMHEAM